MLDQTTAGIPQLLAQAGCYFYTMCRMAELEADRELTLSESEALWLAMVRVGAIQDDPGTAAIDPIWIKQPDVLGDNALRMLGVKKSMRQLGVVVGTAEFWQSNHIWQVMEGKTQRGNKHFRLGDNCGKVIYDPRPGTVIVNEVRRIIYQVVLR